MNTENILLALLRAGVCGGSISEEIKEVMTQDTLEAVYNLAREHKLIHIAGHVLSSLGMLGSDEISKSFKTAALHTFGCDLRKEGEYACIYQTLEAAGIPFIPLKGAVIRRYYPEPWMRNSTDIDILVKPEDTEAAVAALQEAMGYTNLGRRDHDISLHYPGSVHLELHFDMMEDWYAVGNTKTVLSRVWEDTEPKEPGSCHRCMPDELLYFYHIAHMAKHFQTGGCGIRPFLDVWVLNHRTCYDRQKRERLLGEGGLLTFAQAVEKTSEVWFGEEQPDGLTRQIGNYIMHGGAFGTWDNRAAVGQARSGGKLRYLFTRRIFVPYEALKADYPVLNKHKWLTPIYQVVRWCRMLFGGRLGKAWGEWNTNVATQKDASSSMAELLKQLDI